MRVSGHQVTVELQNTLKGKLCGVGFLNCLQYHQFCTRHFGVDCMANL